MSNTTIKEVGIIGFNDPDKVTKLDISVTDNGGTISYTEVAGTAKAIDTQVEVQGVKGNVVKTGTTHSSNSAGTFITAELGSDKANKNISIMMLEDEARYLPHSITDIVNKVVSKSGLSIVYKGYNLCIESYQYSGKIKDCLNDIAGLVYGSVVYDSTKDSYTIQAGDYTQSLNGHTISNIDMFVLEYDEYTEKDSSINSFGIMLLNIAKEIARLRQSIIDITTETDSEASTRTLADTINFKFGSSGGHNYIQKDIDVESTEWDIWYEDELGNKWVNPTKAVLEKDDPKFVPKQLRYFKVETLEETIVVPDGGTGYTVKRGKKRGLRSIGIGTSLYVRLKNIQSTSSVKGKGYLTNLQTLGMPSLTKYNENKANSSADVPYDDGYHTLYEIETREVRMMDNESDTVEALYVPFIRFTCPPGIYNAVYAALSVQLKRAPNSFEVNDAMIKQEYSVSMELMETAVSYGSLLYIGYQDKRGRVISSNNQVMLISGLDNLSYYAPIEGMDINFNSEQPNSSVSTSYNPKIFDEYFDSSIIESSLEIAYAELRTLAIAQDIVCKASSSDYPKFLYEYLQTPINGSNLGRVIGLVMGEKEPSEDLTINAFVTTERQKKRLERKLKALECKINLVIKCMNRTTQVVSLAELKTHLKEIINYEAILYEVKNESIASMQSLKNQLDSHINYFLDNLTLSENSSLNKIKLKIPIPDCLPSIGSGIQFSGKTYAIKSLNSSGLLLELDCELRQ